MRKTLRLIALAAQLGALAACDPIEQLPRDRCGNTVIERGEDCDGAGFGDSVCNELCRLECTAEGACPPGWGCGQDGLCRQPTGAFRPFGNSLPVSAARLTLADVDGDGARDILAADDSGVTVAFAEAGGLSSQTLRVSSAPIDADPDVPAAGDIDGDGRADLALRLGASTSILRGQRDRTLAPQVFSRRLAIPTGDDVLFAINADQRKASPGDEIFSIGQAGISVVHTSNEVDFPAAPILTWPGSEKPVLLSSAGFVVYSVDGSSDVHHFVPFVNQGSDTGAWNQDASVEPVVSGSLPGGAIAQGPAQLAQIPYLFDGNDYQTSGLLVAGESQGQSQLFLTYLLGTGFYSKPPLPGPASPDGQFVEIQRDGPPGATGSILAADNFDKQVDGPDLFTPQGHFSSVCNPTPGQSGCAFVYTSLDPAAPLMVEYSLEQAADPGDAWTRAVRVGAPLYDTQSFSNNDVLVATGKPGLILFRYLESPQATKTYRIQTGSPVRHFAAGDFDGDGARDIVFAQVSSRARPGGPPLDSVHIVRGDAFGLPTTAPVDLGDVGEVTQIFSARLFPTASKKSAVVPEGDGVTDLVVRAKRDGQTLTYVFAGNTEGQPLSPLDLESACEGQSAPSGVPRFSAVVARSGAEAADLAVAYRREATPGTFTHELWSFRPDTSDSEAICASLTGPAALPDLGGTAITMLPADLDGDGTSELLFFARGGSTLVVAKLGDAGWSTEALDLGEPRDGLTTAAVWSDGVLDVVLWSGASVAVLPNDGAGGLDPASAAVVSLQDTTCPAPGAPAPAGAITGAAAVHLRPDAGRELLILTEEATFLAEVQDAAAGPLGEATCAPLLLGGDGGRAVASGDIDGDGVEDLVVARPGGVEVLTGIPVVQ